MSMPFYGWLIIFLLLLAGCNADYESIAERRLEYAKKNKGDIVIAVFQDFDNSNYISGVLLAVEEIRQRQGGLLGRNIKLLIEQDGLDFDSIKPTIRRIAVNPQVSAVLGHRSSKVAIPASVVYEKSHILFLPPFATVKGLTAHNFNYVFRMLPANQILADQMANVATTLGYKKIVTLYARDDYSRELAFLFEEAAIRQGIKLVHHASFFDKNVNFRPVISQFN
ncbi:MAG: amino acid ABC transporter substrate-binding protein, partial [Gammaproteobacteria bacterium]|nr:amino acid ABC transporter substrate-binding protein [Gammaproteobacteria bacterium]